MFHQFLQWHFVGDEFVFCWNVDAHITWILEWWGSYSDVNLQPSVKDNISYIHSSNLKLQVISWFFFGFLVHFSGFRYWNILHQSHIFYFMNVRPSVLRGENKKLINVIKKLKKLKLIIVIAKITFICQSSLSVCPKYASSCTLSLRMILMRNNVCWCPEHMQTPIVSAILFIWMRFKVQDMLHRFVRCDFIGCHWSSWPIGFENTAVILGGMIIVLLQRNVLYSILFSVWLNHPPWLYQATYYIWYTLKH